MPWARVESDYHDHPKTRHLIAITKLDHADIYPIRLWTWCLRFAPGGDLSRFSPSVIAAGIKAKPAIVEALKEAGFIDAETMQVHDWPDHSGKYESQTANGRERIKRFRERKHKPVTVTPALRNGYSNARRKSVRDAEVDESSIESSDDAINHNINQKRNSTQIKENSDVTVTSPLRNATNENEVNEKEGEKIKNKRRAEKKNAVAPGFAAFKDWAFAEWLKAGGAGTWTTKEWVRLHEAYRGLVSNTNGRGEERAHESWINYLDDHDPFFAGHYPSKWASQPARWTESIDGEPF